MNTERVLNNEEEYKFLKKVCPKYDLIVKHKIEHPVLELSRSDWKELRNLVACLLMLDAGLRVGEMIKICYRDLYFHGDIVRTIIVRKEIAKGKVQREIPVSDRLRVALVMFYPGPLLLAAWPLTQKVVSRSMEGAALTTRAIEKMTKWRGIEAINEPVNPHMLRHTFATKLMRITDMATVQNLLGHRSMNSTQRYTHPNTDDTAAAIERMNNPGAASPAAGDIRKCSICGCTDANPCKDGCNWVADDLCSMCAS
jgi:site-specific recombinase XerD